MANFDCCYTCEKFASNYISLIDSCVYEDGVVPALLISLILGSYESRLRFQLTSRSTWF